MLEMHGQVVWENSGWLIVHRKADTPAAASVPVDATGADSQSATDVPSGGAADSPSDTDVPSGVAAAEPAHTSL